MCCLQVTGNVADDTLRRKRLRNRWYKMVTLVNNPSLVFERLMKLQQEEMQLPGISEEERFRHKATTSVAFITWWRTYMYSVTLFRLNFADECEVIESRVWSAVTDRWQENEAIERDVSVYYWPSKDQHCFWVYRQVYYSVTLPDCIKSSLLQE